MRFSGMNHGQHYINALRIETDTQGGTLRWEPNRYDGEAVTITYSLMETPDLRWDLAADPITDNFKPLNPQQESVLAYAMQTFAQVAGVKFERVDSGGDLVIGQYDINRMYGWVAPAALDTTTGERGQMALFMSTDFGDTWEVGSRAYQTLVHELGHVVGLEHTHEGPTTFSWLNDSTEYSVMSYRKMTDGNLRTADIMTLQSIYGPSRDKYLGNTTHKLGRDKIISDAGGVDTISAYGQKQAVVIDLNHGSQSRIGAVESDGDIHEGNQFWLGHFSFIENANGGNGNDRLIGNELGNTLKGYNGNDILTGGDGFDKLYGGSGNDRFVFNTESGRDKVYDFRPGDKLDFRGFDANLNKAGQQDFKFLGNRDSDIKHQKIGTAYFNTKTDTLMIENTGDGKVDYKLQVTGLDALLKDYYLL